MFSVGVKRIRCPLGPGRGIPLEGNADHAGNGILGGFCQILSVFIGVRLASAASVNSVSPWNFLILHRMASFSGSYLAFPEAVLNTLTLAVLLGTGILTTTLLAMSYESKMARTLIL